jgi:hypothetical protein
MCPDLEAGFRPMALLLGDLPGIERVELDRRVTLVRPGLRAGKSPAFLVFRGLARSGRSRTKKPGVRIFSKNVVRARSAWSGEAAGFKVMKKGRLGVG